MLRAVLEGVMLFLTPFLLFALWILVQRSRGGAREKFEGAFAWLTIIGLLLAIASVLWQAARQERSTGAYVPAEQRDGVIIPGHTR